MIASVADARAPRADACAALSVPGFAAQYDNRQPVKYHGRCARWDCRRCKTSVSSNLTPSTWRSVEACRALLRGSCHLRHRQSASGSASAPACASDHCWAACITNIGWCPRWRDRAIMEHSPPTASCDADIRWTRGGRLRARQRSWRLEFKQIPVARISVRLVYLHICAREQDKHHR